MEFQTRIGKAKIKSVGPHVKITYEGETIKLNKRKLKQFFVKVAAFCICIHFVGHALDDAVEKVDYMFDVVAVRMEESKDGERFLKTHNLNTEPNKDGKWGNDYSTIDNISRSDIYSLLRYCGRTETEKILKSMGYASWRQYLAQNGYYDENGEPSMRVWENYMEYQLVNERNEAKHR